MVVPYAGAECKETNINLFHKYYLLVFNKCKTQTQDWPKRWWGERQKEKVDSVLELSVVEPKCQFATMTSATKLIQRHHQGLSLEEATLELGSE